MRVTTTLVIAALGIFSGCSANQTNTTGDMDRTATNKALIEALAAGAINLLDHLADDAVWQFPGRRAFRGKNAIVNDFLGPVTELMESMGRVIPTNIIAEGDLVVFEGFAVDRMTKRGMPYNNHYCVIYQFKDGKIVQVREYSDTALAEQALPEFPLDE